jgi:hypothetical protein
MPLLLCYLLTLLLGFSLPLPQGFSAFAHSPDFYNLTLVTRQNTSESSGSSFGVNAGFGFGAPDADNPTAPASKNVSGGINQGKSDGDRAWADSTSSLVGTESVDISAGGNLGLSGSVIANITDDGTDGGNLRISAASVSFNDLQNHDEYETGATAFRPPRVTPCRKTRRPKAQRIFL